MSLEQYKNANRKELWEILQIQADEIKKLEDLHNVCDLEQQINSLQFCLDNITNPDEIYYKLKSLKAGKNKC